MATRQEYDPRQIEKELQKQVVTFEQKCLKGQVTANVKFEEFAERWFEEYAKLNLRTTSYDRMRQLTTRVYPAIGYLRLDKITARHIQRFINDLVVNGRNFQNGKPISCKTAVHHLSFISDVFGYAVKMDMLTDNPCNRVTVPRGEKKEKEIYTIGEIEQIFTLLESEPLKYRAFIVLAVYSGFRRGELLGLEWKDVDFENNVISVHRTSNYSRQCGIYTDTTKTKKSQRSLKLPPYVMELLKAFRDEQSKEAAEVGSKWINTDRLFTKWDGSPVYPDTPYTWFKRFCTRNGLRFCDLHSMRHQYVKYTTKKIMDFSEKIFRNTQSFLRKTTKGADKPHLFSKCCHCY